MIQYNANSAILINKLVSGIQPDGNIHPLHRTHIEALGKDIDGINAHVGMDGGLYYRLCSGRKEQTCGFDHRRLEELVLKSFSMNELCSLLGETAPEENKAVKTVSLFTDYGYWSKKHDALCGDMGYSLGGDYEESERRIEKGENEQDVIQEYKENIIQYVRESEKSENYIEIWTVEKKTFTCLLDEDGDEIERDEDDDKTILCNIFCCSRKTAEDIGMLKYFDEGENIFIEK